MADEVEGPLRVTDGWTIPGSELAWRFSRSSGPGGQGVNTTDSRVELSWSPATSASLTVLPEPQRHRLTDRLTDRLVNGSIVIAASEHRAQLRNRDAARRRLAQLLREALVPVQRRRPTRPTRGSVERRLQAKKAQSQRKAARGVRSD